MPVFWKSTPAIDLVALLDTNFSIAQSQWIVASAGHVITGGTLHSTFTFAHVSFQLSPAFPTIPSMLPSSHTLMITMWYPTSNVPSPSKSAPADVRSSQQNFTNKPPSVSLVLYGMLLPRFAASLLLKVILLLYCGLPLPRLPQLGASVVTLSDFTPLFTLLISSLTALQLS